MTAVSMSAMNAPNRDNRAMGVERLRVYSSLSCMGHGNL
jgi:hypothetical protein